eukprot:TRINITY_DN42896_c0_g1_i1.p1 TRINITY_DN42896_c0_g1~~TRINITY_DN42896_c0_g1_i1.p1  ORF type:complete len:422 (+),score=107.99 TRINITY_DN42896_c0_g1_i1:49-1314(+)
MRLYVLVAVLLAASIASAAHVSDVLADVLTAARGAEKCRGVVVRREGAALFRSARLRCTLSLALATDHDSDAVEAARHPDSVPVTAVVLVGSTRQLSRQAKLRSGTFVFLSRPATAASADAVLYDAWHWWQTLPVGGLLVGSGYAPGSAVKVVIDGMAKVWGATVSSPGAGLFAVRKPQGDASRASVLARQRSSFMARLEQESARPSSSAMLRLRREAVLFAAQHPPAPEVPGGVGRPQRWAAILSAMGVADKRSRGVEVGVWQGMFAAEMLRRTEVGEYSLVDPWRHLDGWKRPFNVDDDKFQRNYEATVERVKQYGRRARVLRMQSVEASRQFEDESLDFVYLDGDHTASGALLDATTWWRKLKPGGVLCGDDYYPLTDGMLADPKLEAVGVTPVLDGLAASWNRRLVGLSGWQFGIVK